MLNIADNYWKISMKDNARIYYKRYIYLMTRSGKENKIPNQVRQRIN
jgi:hypothetical protein